MDVLSKQYKIGIFRALQLGDLMVTIPAIKALRRFYPKSHISLIGLPWAKDFVKRFGLYFDDFIEFKGYPGLVELPFDPTSSLKFISYVQSLNFDLILQFHGDGSIINPLVELLGAKKTAGFFLPGQYCPNKFSFLSYPYNLPEVLKYLKLIEFLGIPLQGESLEFPITNSDINEFAKLKSQFNLISGQYICLHPGARDPKRRWSIKNFAYIADAFARMKLQVVISGSDSELSIAHQVEVISRYKPLNLAGKTTLGSLALLLKNSRLLISNDTGVSHIADALNVPSIIIFLASDPNRWGPKDKKLHRRVCFNQASNPKHILLESKDFISSKRNKDILENFPNISSAYLPLEYRQI